MPILNKKRQITLSKEQCQLVGLVPGDSFGSFVDEYGHIVITKSRDPSERKKNTDITTGPEPETI